MATDMATVTAMATAAATDPVVTTRPGPLFGSRATRFLLPV